MTVQGIDIQRKMRELGRLRMGDKNEKGYPQKLGKWRMTSASRVLLEAGAERYGGEVREWSDGPDEGLFELYTDTAELEVIVPRTLNQRGEPSFAYSQNYELWSGGGCKRRCDGTTELLSDKPCMCDPDNRTCAIYTRASFMLPYIPSLGVWRLDTKGYYAATEIPAILDLLAGASNQGIGVPAVLRIEKRSVKRADPKNPDKMLTQRFIVPVIDLPSVTLAEAAPQLMSFNAPLLAPAGKPALPAGDGPPADASFEGAPPMGSRPPVANGNGHPVPPTEEAAAGDLFSQGEPTRERIREQFKNLKVGTADRRKILLRFYEVDTVEQLDPESAERFSTWLAESSAEEISAAIRGTE